MAAVCDLPSVLVVEGSDAALEQRLFDFGYRVFTAADGDAAMQALPDIDPDLVLLRRSPPRPVDPSVFDDGTLRVDRGNPEVIVRGETVCLTPIELRLLEALIAHPGRVLSPEQLGHLVWGRLIGEAADCACLYVSYLRAKIEQDTAHPELIETVRGRGYRYRAMAPGGVEPPRADSKSAALSAELRGRAEVG